MDTLFVTDGALWIKERLVPLFPTAVVILDAYHLMEALAKYAAARFGKGSKAAKDFYQRALDAMYGKSRGQKPRSPKKRGGHTKRPPNNGSEPPIMPASDTHHARRRKRAPAAERLLCLLDEGELPYGFEDEHKVFIQAIERNADRIDYERWRLRSYQIGSGAMESLHRTASQTRLKGLKVAGIRCLPETSQAAFNLRMLRLCGRWDEFWEQPGLTSHLVDGFIVRKAVIEQAKNPASAKAKHADPAVSGRHAQNLRRR